jgi:4-hydroxy-2-oxoglutarate aldolase
MARASLTGILAPVVTPFDVGGDIDLRAFTTNGHAHLAAGLSGLVVCGSTGEAALLDETERARLAETARAIVPADATLVVGAGAESTRLCIARCKAAAQARADYVLVVAPHYFGAQMTPAALDAHYRRVADASPVPVLLYNIPKYAHLVLEPDLVASLSTHENILGMKDSAGDLPRLEGYLQSQRDDFVVLTGHGGSWHRALQMGVRGGILAVALFAPRLARRVWDAHRAGDAREAEMAQDALTPLALEIVGRLGVPGVKSALDRVGISGGAPRSPLLPLDEHEVMQVGGMLRRAWERWSEARSEAWTAGTPAHI